MSAAISSLRPGVLMMCAVAFTARLCDALFIQELVKKKKKSEEMRARRCKTFHSGLAGTIPCCVWAPGGPICPRCLVTPPVQSAPTGIRM